ncbi:MAG: BamA/TamA family outer membrane protein [Magnetococcales bacterium]|nr:BamA/TamA family outer membrane protein [Magnetococcales bacterium]
MDRVTVEEVTLPSIIHKVLNRLPSTPYSPLPFPPPLSKTDKIVLPTALPRRRNLLAYDSVDSASPRYQRPRLPISSPKRRQQLQSPVAGEGFLSLASVRLPSALPLNRAALPNRLPSSPLSKTQRESLPTISPRRRAVHSFQSTRISTVNLTEVVLPEVNPRKQEKKSTTEAAKTPLPKATPLAREKEPSVEVAKTPLPKATPLAREKEPSVEVAKTPLPKATPLSRVQESSAEVVKRAFSQVSPRKRVQSASVNAAKTELPEVAPKKQEREPSITVAKTVLPEAKPLKRKTEPPVEVAKAVMPETKPLKRDVVVDYFESNRVSGLERIERPKPKPMKRLASVEAAYRSSKATPWKHGAVPEQRLAGQGSEEALDTQWPAVQPKRRETSPLLERGQEDHVTTPEVLTKSDRKSASPWTSSDVPAQMLQGESVREQVLETLTDALAHHAELPEQPKKQTSTTVARAKPRSVQRVTRGLLLDEPVEEAPSKAPRAISPTFDMTPFAAPEEYVLPPLEEMDEDLAELTAVETFSIDAIQVVGSTVLSEQEIAELSAPYLNQAVTLEELYMLRDALTRRYIDRGYATSGAVLEEQEIGDGTVLIRIIEGQLDQIIITGNDKLRESFIRDRLQPTSSGPFNVKELEQRLQLLRQQPMIENIRTEVRPGVKQGLAVLTVTVEEAKPLQLGVSYGNRSAPNVGTIRRGIEGTYHPFGIGDIFTASFGRSRGAVEYNLSYSLPINAKDTTLSFGFSESTSVVVVAPFAELNITSENTTWYAAIEHPFYRDVNHELSASLKWQGRVSQTSLLGLPFSFTEAADRGETRINSVHLGQSWIYRDARQVLTTSSEFNLGVAIGDVTDNPTTADGQYLAWLGRSQYVRQFDFLESRAIVRSSLRLTDTPMLPTEKFTIGGSSTVRGYRESVISRDQGMTTTVEWQVPTSLRMPFPYVSAPDSDGQVSLAAFYDYGKNWDKIEDSTDPEDLSSYGFGVLWSLNKNSTASFYWGRPLRNVKVSGDKYSQDHGYHFNVNIATF